ALSRIRSQPGPGTKAGIPLRGATRRHSGTHRQGTTGACRNRASWPVPTPVSLAASVSSSYQSAMVLRNRTTRPGRQQVTLFAFLQLGIDHAHEAVGAGTASGVGRQQAAWNFRVIRSSDLRSENFLFRLTLRNQLLYLCLHSEDHVAVRNDVCS